MSDQLIGFVALGGLFGLILLRVPVAIGLGLVGLLGYAAIDGWRNALIAAGATPYDLTDKYSLTVVPLFVLMGVVASRAGMSTELFRAANAAFSGLRGALAMEHARHPFSPRDVRDAARRVGGLCRSLEFEPVTMRGGLDVGGAELDHVWTLVDGEVFFDRKEDIEKRRELEKERERLEKMEPNLPPSKRGKKDKKEDDKEKPKATPTPVPEGGKR